MDSGDFDACSQVVIGNGQQLLPDGVVKSREDRGMDLASGIFELLRRRFDDVVGEGLQSVLQFRVQDLHYPAPAGGHFTLTIFGS